MGFCVLAPKLGRKTDLPKRPLLTQYGKHTDKEHSEHGKK